ncbi:uncharacterized [Tachysurus ichikawai]
MEGKRKTKREWRRDGRNWPNLFLSHCELKIDANSSRCSPSSRNICLPRRENPQLSFKIGENESFHLRCGASVGLIEVSTGSTVICVHCHLLQHELINSAMKCDLGLNC